MVDNATHWKNIKKSYYRRSFPKTLRPRKFFSLKFQKNRKVNEKSFIYSFTYVIAYFIVFVSDIDLISIEISINN